MLVDQRLTGLMLWYMTLAHLASGDVIELLVEATRRLARRFRDRRAV